MQQKLSIKEYAGHQCQLRKTSDSCLPVLPPQTPKYKRLFHDYRKYMTVSKSNPKTKVFFRSAAAIIMERKRQIYTVPKYVIHPFSKLNVIVECVMCFLWFYGYLFDPIFVAFYEMDTVKSSLVIVGFLFNTLASFHIVLCCITGYQITKTKEIVLAPRKILLHYLRTYFIFDFVGSLPFRFVATIAHADFDDVYHNLLSAVHLLRFARISTAMQYLRQITLLMHLDDSGHVLVSLVVATYLILHWISCIVYLSNKLLYYIFGTMSGASWLRRSGISAAQDFVNWYRRYMICLHTVIMNFYCAGPGMELSHVFMEHIFLVTIMIFGSVYYVYALVVTLQLMRSATTSESKYEEFLFQLNDYMRAKSLPRDLRSRIVLYYEHRFQKKFFREQAILSALSEHLRHEIFLQSCKHLMENVLFFKELPKHVVGVILASLKQEVFLPNDVIVSGDIENHSMYFISFGTVAIYTLAGQECLHLADGEHFGSGSLLNQRDLFDTYNIVAIEMTECYRWDRSDFIKCTGVYKGIADLVEKVTLRAFNRNKDCEKEVEYAKHADILSDLKRKKIIEKGAMRR